MILLVQTCQKHVVENLFENDSISGVFVIVEILIFVYVKCFEIVASDLIHVHWWFVLFNVNP